MTEALGRGLAIFSFMLMCWVAHRGLQVRDNCVSSSYIAHAFLGGIRVGNCRFESRLAMASSVPTLNRSEVDRLRAIEVLEPLSAVLPVEAPTLTVEVSDIAGSFEVVRGGVRIGRDWTQDDLQLRRALVLAVLRRHYPVPLDPFQEDVLVDFLVLAVFSETPGISRLKLDLKLPTAMIDPSLFCGSAFPSPSQRGACERGSPPVDLGLRPLLASALWRLFASLPLGDQMQVFARLRAGVLLPSVAPLERPDAANTVRWVADTLENYALAMGMGAGAGIGSQMEPVLRQMDVEAPTRWELTVDLTATPAWREIVQQLSRRSRYRPRERTLVFTPEGEVALPSGLPVAWAPSDIQSQKHVVIACRWPSPDKSPSVRARHLFAEQSCGPLSRPFWD